MAPALHGVYAITDSQLMPNTLDLCAHVLLALEGGVKIVQYRDKSDDQQKRIEEATALKELCHEHGAALLINDDINLAHFVGADGVHLGQSDGDVLQARGLLGENAIIGVTCHDSMDFARKAQAEGANYVAFGAFFKSKTKPNAKPAPLSLLAQAKAELSVPVVAIGGITVDNASQLTEQGCDMLAVVHSLFAEPGIRERAERFAAAFNATPDRITH